MSENNNDKKSDILLAQYDAVSNQIIHWDTFFWKKSTVLFAFESAAFLGVVKVFISKIIKDHSLLSLEMLWVILTTIFLSLYMCVVWLRTGIRNREFLNIRFDMGRNIENYFRYQELTLYNFQHWQTHKPSSVKSHQLEVSIPLVFELVWLLVMIYLLLISP